MRLQNMNENQVHQELFTKNKAWTEQLKNAASERLADMLDYTVDEMLTQVEFDIPVSTQQKEKVENERIMMKQLLGNIERNRVKWRKEVFESDTLSLGRKMAMQGVKDKIDQQAQVLQEEEIEVKEKLDKLRHQNEQLKSLKQKLDHLNRNREDSDRRRALLKEAQVDFDKYLRFYAKESKELKR